jgi:hypothetical protein
VHGQYDWGNLRFGAQLTNGQLSLDDVRGADASNGFVYVVGQDSGRAAQQVINLSTGTVGSVDYFWSIHQGQNNGNGLSGGLIQEVVRQNNGSMLYLGDSNSFEGGSVSTIWWNQQSPIAPGPVGTTGSLLTASRDGIIAGGNGAVSAVGFTNGILQELPASPGTAIGDTTSNGSYLVGNSGAWRLTDRETLNYERLSTNHWTLPGDALSFDGTFQGVLDVGDDTFFAGSYVDAVFNLRVGLWDETGQFLGSTLGGSSFADLGYFENELILGVNGPGGLGTLYRLSDMSDPFSLSSLYGSNVSLVQDSFYNGSFGFIAFGSSGTFVTRYELNSIPEPSSFVLIATLVAIFCRRRRIPVRVPVR